MVSKFEKRVSELERVLAPLGSDHQVDVGGAATIMPMLRMVLEARQSTGDPPAITDQLVPAIAGPGPHHEPPARDPMRPFRGRYGTLDKLPPENNKFAAYGAGQPDGGKFTLLEPSVV
jgi:hypothetical protein